VIDDFFINNLFVVFLLITGISNSSRVPGFLQNYLRNETLSGYVLQKKCKAADKLFFKRIFPIFSETHDMLGGWND